MSLYILHIKKITKLLPNIYLIYISPSKSITKLNTISTTSISDEYTIKVYIPDSIKINYSIHDFNHQYDLNMMREGMYSINMIYSDKYSNYNITSIKLINYLKLPNTDDKAKAKTNTKSNFKSKKDNMINNIIGMTTIACKL